MANVGGACEGRRARALPLQPRSDRNSSQSGRPSEQQGRTRWLANAEADHGGAILRRRAVAHRARRRSCGHEGSRRSADRDAGEGARPGKDGPRAGVAGHAPQTELAESEAVSDDRTRPPPAHSRRP